MEERTNIRTNTKNYMSPYYRMLGITKSLCNSSLVDIDLNYC